MESVQWTLQCISLGASDLYLSFEQYHLLVGEKGQYVAHIILPKQSLVAIFCDDIQFIALGGIGKEEEVVWVPSSCSMSFGV